MSEADLEVFLLRIALPPARLGVYVKRLKARRADPSASQIVRNQDRRVAEDRRGAKSTWGGGGMTAKASEVAVAQTPRYDLTINLKTTEALGLIVLQAVL